MGAWRLQRCVEADLGRIILKYQFAVEDWYLFSYDQLVRQISARMVVILLDFPLLAWSWYQATIRASDEVQERSELLTRNCFVRFELVIYGLVLFLLLGICLYNFFNWVLGVSEINWVFLATPLSYGLVALVFFVIKLLRLFSLRKRLT